jgi:hypothetical protein
MAKWFLGAQSNFGGFSQLFFLQIKRWLGIGGGGGGFW